MNENKMMETKNLKNIESDDLEELVTSEFSQGFFRDGMAILRNGRRMTVEEILGELHRAQELTRQLDFALDGLKQTSRSLGFDITHVRKIQERLAKA
jgi:hypothetical protein